MNQAWSAPYYGVQQLGQYSLTTRWCTVEAYMTYATLTKWQGPDLMQSEQINFQTAEEARTAGETWIKG